MIFNYAGRTRAGERVTGTVEANDKVSAILAVERLGHVPITITPATGFQPTPVTRETGNINAVASAVSRPGRSPGQIETNGHPTDTVHIVQYNGFLKTWLWFVGLLGALLFALPFVGAHRKEEIMLGLWISGFGFMMIVSVAAISLGRKWGVYAMLVVWISLSSLADHSGIVALSFLALIIAPLFGLLHFRWKGTTKGWSQLGGGMRPVVVCIVCAMLLVLYEPSARYLRKKVDTYSRRVEQEKIKALNEQEAKALMGRIIGRWMDENETSQVIYTFAEDHKCRMEQFVKVNGITLPATIRTVNVVWRIEGRDLIISDPTTSKKREKGRDTSKSTFAILKIDKSIMEVAPRGAYIIAGSERKWSRVDDTGTNPHE